MKFEMKNLTYIWTSFSPNMTEINFNVFPKKGDNLKKKKSNIAVVSEFEFINLNQRTYFSLVLYGTARIPD